jgi:predicted DNA-binding ribbon-helix-helix protein
MKKLQGNRGLVNRKATSISIEKTLFNEFKRLADETKVPMSRLMDEAIELLLEKRKPNKKGRI